MTTLAEKYRGKLYWEVLRKQGVLQEILLEWLRVLELKIKLYRERQQLKVMSDRMLDDIGITRAEAELEAGTNAVPQERLDALKHVA